MQTATVNSINASTDSRLHISSPGVSFSTILRGYAPPPSFTPSGLPLRGKDGKTMVVGLSERACEGHLENSQDISLEKYQESREDVKTKPSVRGHDPSLTVILEEIPSGALIWRTIEDLVGQDSDVCSYNENDVSDNDKSSCDSCESFSKAKTKHNSNMDLHAVDLVHEDAPERLEARHVADVVVRVTDLGTLPCPETLATRRFFKTSPTNVYSCGKAAIKPEFAGRNLVLDDVLADTSRPNLNNLQGTLSRRNASTSPPRTTTYFMLSQAFLNISPLRLCGCVACFLDTSLSAQGSLMIVRTLRDNFDDGSKLKNKQHLAHEGYVCIRKNQTLGDEVAHTGHGLQVWVVKDHRPGDPGFVRKGRLVKYRPNTPEMIRRYFMAAVSDKTYQLSCGRRILKFQELKNLDPRNRSYMVVDLNVNTSRLLAQKTRLRILNCDAETSLLKQVKAIMRSFGNIMIFNGTFQDFLVSEGVMECLISGRFGFYLKVIPLALPRSHSIPHVAVAARQS
ncbi:kinesin motor domain-containing protein [Colletotrichum filicis]|nr:kinesin motor domain-containing protein [Colletotrichum filicis]